MICARYSKTRDGFTLLELVLVLALIVIVYALATPAMRGPLASQRLQKSGDQVRAMWARARVLAMRSGRVQRFQFQMESGECHSESHEPDAGEDAYPPESEYPDSIGSADSDQLTLPEGITCNQLVTRDRRSKLVAARSQVAASRRAGWSDPVFFFPDGTTSTAELELVNEEGSRLLVSLRGLTGMSQSKFHSPAENATDG